ncbi:MAG: putative lipid II flippase FtsW [Candidatus Woesebacteria bacterium]|nr:putative lipid II flippase FtsW [Candidatus Woesebacteria bacterium]
MRNLKSKLSKQRNSVDKKLLFLILSFTVIGLVAVADASAPQALNNFGDKFFLFRQQLEWVGIGLVTLLVTSKIKYTFWEKLATPFFFVSLILLLAVLLPRLGFSALGARRWIVLGSVNFQPSEVIKFAICVYFAKLATRAKGALSYFIPLVIVVTLIMFQPDLGTALIVTFIGLSQVFVSGISLWYLLDAGVIGLLVGIPLILLSPYRKERLLTFLQMTEDPLGKSYHMRQILLGLGSGGIFGVGLGASRQKYSFLPEASTDSIFAVIAEELGLIGGIVVIGLFVYFIVRTLKIARNAPDTFSKTLAIGIATWIGGQAFLNIASMVALVPLTGIPLPFISYGGSSLVMILAACGILLNISRFAVLETKHGKPKIQRT